MTMSIAEKAENADTPTQSRNREITSTMPAAPTISWLCLSLEMSMTHSFRSRVTASSHLAAGQPYRARRGIARRRRGRLDGDLTVTWAPVARMSNPPSAIAIALSTPRYAPSFWSTIVPGDGVSISTR